MQHTKQGGYMIEAGEDPKATLEAATEEIISLFE